MNNNRNKITSKKILVNQKLGYNMYVIVRVCVSKFKKKKKDEDVCPVLGREIFVFIFFNMILRNPKTQ